MDFFFAMLLACAAAFAALWFGIGALFAGDYRDVEGIGDGCYVATEYTIPWYNPATNTITKEETVCE